jgi:hypothetical protein
LKNMMVCEEAAFEEESAIPCPKFGLKTAFE